MYVAAYALSAQAVSLSTAIVQKPEMVFENVCRIVQTPDNRNEWELDLVRPAGLIGVYYNNIRQNMPDLSKAEVNVLHGPKHGLLNSISPEEAKQKGLNLRSGPIFSYLPRKGYLGPDDATFMVALDGKRYKIHSTFYVVWQRNDDGWYETGTPATRCAQSKYKRVAEAAVLSINPNHG